MHNSSGKFIADKLRASIGTGSSLEEIFEEEPVPLKIFIEDAKYLGDVELSDIQFDAVRHIEQVYYPDLYPLMVEEFGPYWEPVRFCNEAWIEWGKGSGKDHVCRVSAARIVYLLLCLKSPQKYFGMPVQDSIHTLNVATSAPQAYRAFFSPLKRLIQRSVWFKDKFEIRSTENTIAFDKYIESISGHSQAESQEGLNLVLAVMDEIGAFRTKAEIEMYRATIGREPSLAAETIVDMCKTSIRTRFPKNGKLVGISYPRFKGDYIQTQRKRGEVDFKERGERSRIYTSGPYATWDVNPRVSKEDLADEYEPPNDPAIAKAKYECQPELSTSVFMRNRDALILSFSTERDIPPITVQYYWGKDEDEGDVVEGWQVKFIYAPDFVPMEGAAYAMHGDIGIRSDRAGVAMSHIRTWRNVEHIYQDEDGADVVTDERRPVVKLDFVTKFEADLSAQPQPREVQIRWYRKLAYELLSRGFNLALYTFDGFQSIDSMQILASKGIESLRMTTDDPAGAVYGNFRDLLYDARFEGYKDDDVVLELLSLTRLPNGKIDHPPNGSKDMADAVACSVMGAIQLASDEGDAPEQADIGDLGELYTGETDMPGDLIGLGDMLWQNIR